MDKILNIGNIKDQLTRLPQLVFEVTDACNLKCKYCGYGEFYNDHDERTNQFFTVKRAKILLDYLKELWLSGFNTSKSQQVYISFYGGEPLMNMKFVSQVVEYIEKLKIPDKIFAFAMTTNAMLLILKKVIWNIAVLIINAHFIACSDSTPDSTLKYIDVEKNIHNFEPFALSTIARDLEYIVLDSSEPALIGALKYIDINDHYIIAADGIKVILFDSKGKYIRKIGNEGRGPGEYLYLCQPKIMDTLIYLPDASNSSLLVYNLNGQFERKINAPGKFSNGWQVNNWWPINSSAFFIHHPNTLGDERIKISSINQHGDILKEYLNSSFFPTGNTYFATSDMYANFISFNDMVYFKELLNDTVWLIGDTNLEPAYIIGMGKYGFKLTDRALPLADFHNKLSETILTVNFFESPNYLFFVMNFMKHYPFPFKKIRYLGNEEREEPYPIIGAYSKDKDYFSFVAPSKDKEQVERTGIENDIDGGINFLPKYNNNGKELIGWFDAYELKMYVSSDAFKNSTPKYPEKKRELERLANSLSENDNPVLMIVKLKE